MFTNHELIEAHDRIKALEKEVKEERQKRMELEYASRTNDLTAKTAALQQINDYLNTENGRLKQLVVKLAEANTYK